jgi:hypothetical protein
MLANVCFINMLVEANPYSSKKGLGKDQRAVPSQYKQSRQKIDGVEVEVGTEGRMFNMRSS